MEDKQANETMLELIKSIQETNEAVAASFVAAQERNVKLVQSLYTHTMEVLQGQAESTRTLMQELGQHASKQQEVLQRMASQGTFQKMAKESMDAYMNLLRSPLTYYQQAIEAAQTATRQGLESFRKATESYQKATQQSFENFQKVARKP
jgi:hypothetical protein